MQAGTFRSDRFAGRRLNRAPLNASRAALPPCGTPEGIGGRDHAMRRDMARCIW